MSRYSDDAFSTTSSQWTTTYKRLPKKQPIAIRILSWAAGAPPGATVVKKRTRDRDDDSRSTRSGASSYFADPYTQMYWVMAPEPRGSYHSSSGGSSRSSRSSKSSRSGKSSRHHHRAPAGGPPAPPPPMAPPPMHHNGFPPPPPGPPMGGHFVDDMGGPYPPPPMNVPPPMMPMPPPSMNGGAPAFFDVSGQNQPGNPFQHGPPGGFRGAHVDDDDDDDESSMYSDE